MISGFCGCVEHAETSPTIPRTSPQRRHWCLARITEPETFKERTESNASQQEARGKGLKDKVFALVFWL